EKAGTTLTVHAKIVIAADGDRSILRKRLMGTANERKKMVAAIRTYYKGVKKEGDNNHYEVFAYPEVLPGYFWIFPMADGTFNVGLGVTSDVIQQKKLNLRKLMEELIAKYPYLSERFKNAEMIQAVEGSGLPIMLEKEPKLSDDRILLTGDAASIADPISGEGIGPGIVTGKYAALVAIDAVRANDFSAAYLTRYDKIIHQKITNAYELRIRLFDWFIKHPWKINWLVWLAPKAGFIRNFFNNAANMRFSLKDIKNPLHWGRIFGATKTNAGA
ncbi:MAG: FAD-dependent monooxygenase, partial [Chitinophagaceae bacterium]|nr:FAD-dependent monooxygenase [Chitinophagaceae bacterium]